MKKFGCVLAAVLACTAYLCAPVAQAASGDQITRFDVEARVDSGAVLNVTTTFDVKFASSGHGPYFTFTTRQKYDENNDRLYTYGNYQVSSPSGAPAQFSVIEETRDVRLKIGDPNHTVSGTQSYIVSYTVSGLVNSDVKASDLDEVYWNVIGTGWEIPISNVTVTLTGPAAVSRTACYMGTDYTDPCTSNSFNGPTAMYTQSSLSPAQGLAVTGGWPVGTFPGATMILVPPLPVSVSPSALTPVNPFSFYRGGSYWAGGSVVLSGVAALAVVRLKRKGRDEQYANVPAGMTPAQGDEPVTKREEVLDVPVEFAPPKGVPPRLAGACVRDDSTNEDLTATIVDLAVRGYIHMDQNEDGDFDFTRTPKDLKTLDNVERQFYHKFFAVHPRVTNQFMSSAIFYETYLDLRSLIRQEFLSQPWYNANPGDVVYGYRTRGIMVAALGSAAAILFGFVLAVAGIPGFMWLAIPCLVLGIGMVTISKRMPVRTPLGSAVAIQSLGFKKYLETAEADQIRWEEGQDIFSEYLPYAISFGCADHWSGIVQELVAQGARVPQPQWCTGYQAGSYPDWGSIGDSVHSIDTSFSSSVSSYNVSAASEISSAGASGESGFSGGGGGGGAGGGGGGTW